jgi:hypothetical protein
MTSGLRGLGREALDEPPPRGWQYGFPRQLRAPSKSTAYARAVQGDDSGFRRRLDQNTTSGADGYLGNLFRGRLPARPIAGTRVLLAA